MFFFSPGGKLRDTTLKQEACYVRGCDIDVELLVFLLLLLSLWKTILCEFVSV